MKETDKIPDYIEELKQDGTVAAGTRANYKNVINRFYRSGYDEISHDTLLEYLDGMMGQKNQKYVHSITNILKNWCYFLGKPEAVVQWDEIETEVFPDGPKGFRSQWDEIRYCADLIKTGEGRIVSKKTAGRTVRYTVKKKHRAER